MIDLALTSSIMIGICIALLTIFHYGIKQPSLSLGILIAGLPLLNQSYRVGFLPTSISFETLAVLILWFSTQLNGLKRREASSRRHPDIAVYIMMYTFMLTSALSSVFAPRFDFGSLHILLTGGIAPLLCFTVASRHIVTRKHIHYLTICVMLIAIQTAIYTLIKIDKYEIEVLGTLPTEQVQSLYSSGINAPKASNLFRSPSGTVSVVILAVPLAIWYSTYGMWQRKLISIGVIASIILVTVLSRSRGAWLGLSIALLGSTVFLSKRTFFSGVVIVFSVFIGAYASGFVDYAITVIRVGIDTGADPSIRIINYQLSLQSATRFPLLGLGLGHYPEIYRIFPYALASQAPPLVFAHSLFLTLIPEIGLLGAVAFASLITYSIIRGVCCLQHIQPQEIVVFVKAILIGVSAYLVIASTTGAHLVLMLHVQPLTAPSLIVVFSLLGALNTITRGSFTTDTSETEFRTVRTYSPISTSRDEIRDVSNNPGML